MKDKTGVVMRSTGLWYDVREDNHSEIWRCRLRGKFKTLGLKVTNPLAVGDRVGFMAESSEGSTGIITEIFPRINYIIRQSVHKTAHSHLLAANIDQAVLIVTLAFPRTSLGFVDRFLVSSESFRIPSVLVFNKIDLLDARLAEIQRSLETLYESLGYSCLATSASQGIGLEALREKLHARVSFLAGHSGVGKSTLLNALSPSLDLRTKEISKFANKGVHTTTFTEMLEISPHTFVIDSPGIKELALSEMEPFEISHYFPEMRDLLNQCRFDNCLHVNEPGCTVKAAVENGGIALSRFESYLSMLANEDNRR